MTGIAELTGDTFQAEVLEAEVPVVVDFGAEWCHPCKQLDTVVEELAKEWEGKVKFLKIDADTNVDATMRYQVFGLPTLILFKDGEPKERLTGYQPKHRIVHHFGPYLDLVG